VSVDAPEKVAPRSRPARLSEALGAKLDPRVRAFADHLGRAVAESILRDIRSGRCGSTNAEGSHSREAGP
jgi:hypothetical protein